MAASPDDPFGDKIGKRIFIDIQQRLKDFGRVLAEEGSAHGGKPLAIPRERLVLHQHLYSRGMGDLDEGVVGAGLVLNQIGHIGDSGSRHTAGLESRCDVPAVAT
jgi:hypothetical protein